jgi:hypothetical protein
MLVMLYQKATAAAWDGNTVVFSGSLTVTDPQKNSTPAPMHIPVLVTGMMDS